MLKYRSVVWAIFAVILMGCRAEVATPGIGQAAPSFTLERLTGGQLHFPSDLKGKVVAVQFWADWCPPCISEMRQLAPSYAQYEAQGVVVLAVNLRQEKESVVKLVTQFKLPYEFVLDSNGDVAQKYGVKTLPTGFIVDRAGIIRTRILGEPTTETFAQIIQSVL